MSETRVRGVTVALAAVVVWAWAVSASSADNAPAAGTTSEGQKTYNNYCRTCHSTKQGDDRLGPSLAGVVGRKAGGSSGYHNYSQALAQSGIAWDAATLDRFIANPDAVVPGNNMKPFSGIHDAAVRKQIIEYLESTSGKD